ncbi:hypothetical protein GBAR_LOCUS12218, partial [Geodia barretti]
MTVNESSSLSECRYDFHLRSSRKASLLLSMFQKYHLADGDHLAIICLELERGSWSTRKRTITISPTATSTAST